MIPRQEGHRYYAEHRAGHFYLRTNKGAKNFRLVKFPGENSEEKNWQEVLAHRPLVKIEDFDVFQNHIVVSQRGGGLPGFCILDFTTGKNHEMTFPDPAYEVSAEKNPEFHSTSFRFRYESLVHPNAVLEYDLVTKERKVLKVKEVLGGYRKEDYHSERIMVPASDGTAIPLSLVYKKDLVRDGSRPLLLYGYGAYGWAYPTLFQSERLSLLDRGVVYAIAHVRGGGEMGEIWHEQGKMLNKKNSFTDFIACADYLVREKYTRRNRLVIEGRSAGGLLMGGVMTLRPDLAKAVLLHVPFLDVINTMLDTSLPLTVPEFLEWGNPQIKKEYDYMKSYCPYSNLKAQDYPAILLTTSLHDSQVMYFEPAKYTAKLRSLKTDKNVGLLKTNMAGGHGGFSGRYDAWRDNAFVYAFILWQMGLEKR
jgi:oligopeptidase B